jgi:chemotaxis protein methyltransferase CheR
MNLSTALAERPGIGEDEAGWEDPGQLGRAEFQRLAAFVENYSGIKMPPSKLTMMEGRLRRRVRATGRRSYAEYCAYVFDQGGMAAESVHLIDAVTTNKTDFFREPDHFRLLTDHVLPELAAAPRATPRTPLKLWSAACSIGAEPYTLAMVLADYAQRRRLRPAVILATDLCTEALATAVSGIYPEPMAEPIPPELRRRYVMRAKNPERAEVRIVPELRAMVRFARLNFMDASYPVDRDMDIIFCRNILIYFEKQVQEAVLGKLCEHLRPGGYLFLGHSETITRFALPLDPVGPTMFRRH